MKLRFNEFHPESTYPFLVSIENQCDWDTLQSMKAWIVNQGISASFISNSKQNFWFKNERDATMFMLRWS